MAGRDEVRLLSGDLEQLLGLDGCDGPVLCVGKI